MSGPGIPGLPAAPAYLTLPCPIRRTEPASPPLPLSRLPGLETLSLMEKVPTDDEDRPLQVR